VHLFELIQEDQIKIDLEATTKWEAIEELIDVLVRTHELRITDRGEVLDAILARERSLSTGLEHGLAVPHGTVGCVPDLIGSLGVSRKGIPFESADGQPARIIALLVIPKGAYPRHVRTLAGIARLASNKELRDRVVAAKTPADILDTFYALESADGSPPR